MALDESSPAVQRMLSKGVEAKSSGAPRRFRRDEYGASRPHLHGESGLRIPRSPYAALALMPRNWLAPPGIARRVRQVLFGLLLGVAGMALVAAEAANHYPTAPAVGFAAATLALIILVRVPIRGTAESSTVFPGTPEQLFQIATDIKLSLQVNPNRGRLISQTGPPGQPGSSYVTQISGGVWTTTVVSSDPPRKLVTNVTGPGTWHMDREVTYTPTAEGTRSEDARVFVEFRNGPPSVG